MKLLLLLLVIVHWSCGTALIWWYGHCIFDSAVGFLRVENVRVVSLYWTWLLNFLLVKYCLLISLPFSHWINQTFILLHDHDEAVLRLRLHLTSCANYLVKLCLIFLATFACSLGWDLLLSRNLSMTSNFSSLLEASRLCVDDHLPRVLPLLLCLSECY